MPPGRQRAALRNLLDDDGGNAEALEPSAERDTALAARRCGRNRAARVAERRRVRALALEPAPAVAGGAMGNAVLARHAAPLLMAIELGHRREEGPASIATQPQVTLAAREPGLQGEPRFDDAVRLGGILDNRPGGGRRRGERRLERPYDRFVPLYCLDVPGEGQELAPIAFAANILIVLV